MKKAFAILAILIIVTGALFADAPVHGVGSIKIKSTVERQDPTFVIKAFYENPASPVTGAQVVTGDEDGEDVFVNDISQGEVSVDFAIYQTSPAKNRYKYSFKVEVTKFKGAVYAYTVNGDVTVGQPTTNEWYVTNTTEGIGFVEEPVVIDNVLTCSVTFNGNKAVAESDTAKTSFNVTWEDDKAAPADDYEAEVKMTVTVS